MKQKLKNKIIAFQQKIISLTQSQEEKDKQFNALEKQYALELIEIIDAFESIFNNLATKESALDKTSKRVIKSCRSVYRKTLRILEEKEINQMEFLDNQAQVGLCKIIETQSNPELKDGHIIAIVKNGYQQKDRIIRVAEVITVSNKD